MSFYSRVKNFLAGSTARGSDIRYELDAVATGFDTAEAAIVRALKIPSGETTDQVLTANAAARANKYVAFDSSGNVTLQTQAVDVGFAVLRRAIATSDTVETTDRAGLLSCTAALTLTMDAAATLTNGFFCFVQNAAAGNVTLTGAETVDGVSSITVESGETRLVQCDGNVFRTVVLGASQSKLHAAALYF